MDVTPVIIDLEHLETQTMGDRDLAAEVMQIFVEQMELQKDRLDKDASDLKQLAHSIKGSARGIGAWQVAQQAEIVELAEDGLTEKLQHLAQAMRAACDEANAFLNGK